MTRQQFVRAAGVATLAVGGGSWLSGCGDGGGGPGYLDVSSREVYTHPNVTRIKFRNSGRLNLAGSGVRSLFLVGTSNDADWIDITIRSRLGRAQLSELARGSGVVRPDGSAVVRANRGNAAGIYLTATSFGNAGEPGDFLEITSRYGTCPVQVWIEPTLGLWRQRDRDGRIFNLEIVAVHAALVEHEGRPTVFAFSPPRRRNADGSFVLDPSGQGGGFQWGFMDTTHMELKTWDPGTNTATNPTNAVPADRALDLFCAGHAFLPDGRLLIAGGHSAGPFGPSHHPYHVYDGQAARLTQLAADLDQPRWYPTVTTMPDGRMLITSGSGAPLIGESLADAIAGYARNIRRRYALFDPALGAEVRLTDEERMLIDEEIATYPAVFVLPAGEHASGGAVFVQERHYGWLFSYHDAGTPLRRANRRYEMTVRGWRSYPHYGSSVLLPFAAASPSRLRVLATGGQNETDGKWDDFSTTAEATNTVEIFDYERDKTLFEQSGWRRIQPMANHRFLHDATLLADGNVLISGGASRGWTNENQDPVFAAELFDSEGETFAPAARAAVDRRYHSTALLMPDGSVFKMGSTGGFGSQRVTDPRFDAEQYLPPYLWRGPRPAIVRGLPGRVNLGDTLQLAVRGGSLQNAVVALVRVGSVTHGNNMDQRYVRAEVTGRTRTSDGVTLSVNVPSSGTITPPGPYLVFVVDDSHVPSEGRFTRIALA